MRSCSGSAALPTATVTLLLVQAVPLYLSEMAPPQLRGGLNIMFQMATTIGERQDSLLACHACRASGHSLPVIHEAITRL